MIEAASTAFFTVVAVVITLFLLAWPAYRIVTMWLMREASAGEAVAALVILLAFLAGIVTTWGQATSMALLGLFALLCAVIWFAGRQHDKRRLDRFFREDLEAAQRALARDPDNAAAHMRLGELYARRGDWDTAIEHYEQAARLVPRDSEARLALANAIERKRRETLKSLICFACGTENGSTAAYCRECGALISERNRLIGILTESAFAKTLPWIGFSALLVAVSGTFLEAIPPTVTILAYLLLFATVLCYVCPRWTRMRP